MAAVEEYLVRRGDGLVLLFTPPFDHSDVDPGYVKGYVPGIRENGGQYTHGAIWSVLAFAALGDGDKAGELFSILNPINHASTRAGVQRYKVEPYVMAADVYTEPPHVGRGGWTWYTGSAGWMYQAGVEWILGFRLRGATLAAGSLHPPRLAGLRDRLPLSLRHGTRSSWRTRTGSAAGWRRRSSTDRRCRAAAPRSRSSTTAPRTGSGSSSAESPVAPMSPVPRRHRHRPCAPQSVRGDRTSGLIEVFDIDRFERIDQVGTDAGAHTIGLDADRPRMYAFLRASHRAAVFVDA